ncbi:LOW QUALITY PROTEIN: hypothetical protein QYF61_010682 [Mycteria americana]|uniref:Uncharacterized protein n=1 Tax=Mycteria americana TaxID=33587 RepID=A0AAN7PII7_MYCAM|nr:LOW QUALITY PROTEIN: hypothetical protein QYF61_010682 [Mycteria americana]
MSVIVIAGSKGEIFPNIQSKPLLAQLEAISSFPITCYLGEETDPHLATTSFQAVVESDKVSPQPPFLQAKEPQFPQPLLIRLLLQTLHQLRCPSLDMLQHLNVSLVVRGPKLNTVIQPLGSSSPSRELFNLIPTNCLGWKRPLRLSSPTVNLALPSPPLNYGPKHHIYTSLKYPQGYFNSTTSLGSLFQCLIILSIKKFFLISNLNLPWHNLRPLPLSLSLRRRDRPPPLYNLLSAVEGDKVSPQPPFLQAKQHQFPQLLLISLTLHQLRCPSLDTVQHLSVFLVARSPKLNTVFKVRPHQCHVEGDNHFLSPAGHTISDTSQDAIGLLGHLGTLLAHVHPAVNQHPQVLFCQAAFQPLFPKPVALHGVVVTQVQDPALSLVEPHTVGLNPSIQPVQVPLQSLPPLKQINTPTQLGVVCKLTEGALDPFVQIIDKDVKQNWPQHRALGNTACDRPPTGVNSIHHNWPGHPASFLCSEE